MERLWHVDLGWHFVLLSTSAIMFLVFILSRSRGRSQQMMYSRDVLSAWREELVMKYSEGMDGDDDSTSDWSSDIQLQDTYPA